MYLLRIIRPDNEVYCTITYDRSSKGYRFINLSHNHICSCVFKTFEDAIIDLEKNVENGSVISYDVISNNFDVDKVINNLL